MRCPTCRKSIDAESPEYKRYRPFCCARCKMIDLGRWLDGSYTIPAEAAPEEELAAESDVDDEAEMLRRRN